MLDIYPCEPPGLYTSEFFLISSLDDDDDDDCDDDIRCCGVGVGWGGVGGKPALTYDRPRVPKAHTSSVRANNHLKQETVKPSVTLTLPASSTLG